jgi:hypothetical protein
MQFFHRRKRTTRLITSVVIFLFLIQLVAPVANAQFTDFANLGVNQAQLFYDQWHNAQQQIKEVTKEAKDSLLERIFKGLVLSVSLTLRNTAVMATRSLAQGVTKKMASGDWGPMGDSSFYTDMWGKMLKDSGERMVGKMLDELRDSAWDELGLDICSPSIPELKLPIALGLDLQKDQKMAEPDCSLANLKGNYTALKNQIENKIQQYKDLNGNPAGQAGLFLTEFFDTQVGPGRGEISVGLELRSELRKNSAGATYAEEMQRTEFEGGKTALNLGSGKIKTPAFLTRGYIMSEQDAMVKDKPEFEAAGKVISDIPEAILGSFLTTFVSSAIKELTAKLLQKGLVNGTEEYVPPLGNRLGYKDSGASGTRIDVAFSNPSVDISRVNVSFDVKEYNLLNDFMNCTEPKSFYNCVIDRGFAQAVLSADQDKALTLREAVEEEKLIKGEKKFISKSDLQLNQDMYCYEKGFCYNNLVKLRIARIIPVGWEMLTSLLGPGETITLDEAMNVYNDESSDYYGLIDPNWILKYPKNRCMAEGYSSYVSSAQVGERDEYCADLQNCIKSDDQGNCLSWGYCAAEKNVWRFGGIDCQPEYASCTTMRSRTGNSVNYLLNTVNNSVCGAENAGCAWYSKIMNRENEGICAESGDSCTSDAACDIAEQEKCIFEWNWIDNSIIQVASHDNVEQSIINLNKNIENKTCSSRDEGCTEFIREKVDYGANMWPNGRFEEYTGSLTNAVIAGLEGSEDYLLNEDVANGSYSLNLLSPQVFTGPRIVIPPKYYKRYFVLSFYIKDNSEDSSVELKLSTRTSDPDYEIYDVLLEDESTILDDADAPAVEGSLQLSAVPSDFEKVSVMIQLSDTEIDPSSVTNVNNSLANYGFIPQFVPNGDLLINDMNLVEISIPSWTVYDSTIELSGRAQYGAINADTGVYLKKAPEYLGCYDTDIDQYYGRPLDLDQVREENDAKNSDRGPMQRSCSNFAKLCTAEDVGCDGFTPVDQAVGYVSNTVYGIPSFEDYCPSDCVGYRAFKQVSTNFEVAAFPLYLIPARGEMCEIQEVGCDEFTNLDVLAAGGEGREYYSKLKQCVKIPENDSQCTTFYTWTAEGTEGYQLQEHYLKGDGSGPAFTNSSGNDGDCNETTYNDNLSPDSNPNCTQFYDEAGDVYYGFASEAVTCSEDCHPYRRTIQYESLGACTIQGGEWSDNDKECIFMAIPNQGATCQAENAGCRRYEGNFVGDEKIIFQTGFDNWEEIHGPDKEVTVSGSSGREFFPEGPVLKLKAIGTGTNSFLTNSGKVDLSSFESGEYLIEFWAKSLGGDGDLAPRMTVVVRNDVSELTDFDDVGVFNSWNLYSYKFEIDDTYTGQERVGISVFDTNNDFIYLDNFKITKISDTNYLIKDSWDTPAVCDNAITYVPTNDNDRQMNYAMVGCRQYTDTAGSTHYLRSFSGLCKSMNVGCEALIDTKNSSEFAPAEIDVNTVAYMNGGNENRLAALSSGQKEFVDYLVSSVSAQYIPYGGYSYAGGVSSSITLAQNAITPIEAVTAIIGLSSIVNDVVIAAQQAASDAGSANNEDDIRAAVTEAQAALSAANDAQAAAQGAQDIAAGGTEQEAREAQQAIDAIQLLVDEAQDAVYEADLALENFLETLTLTTISSPRDEVMYLVVNDEAKCASNQKGCSVLGKPELSVDDDGNSIIKTVDGKQVFNEYYYLLEPDSFEQELNNVLCINEAVSCEEYTDLDNGKHYFKNSGDMVCEYRAGFVGGQTVKDWFKKGIKDDDGYDVKCNTFDYYVDGSKQLIKNTDENYDPGTNWVGQCVSSANRCTAFVDQTDKNINEYGDVLGKAYYYIKDDNIDRSCTQVDRKEGCILFNDTSDSNLDKNSYTTYIQSRINRSDNGDFGSVIPLSESDFDYDWNDTTGYFCTDAGFDLWNANDDQIYCKEMESCLRLYQDAGNITNKEDIIAACMAKLEAHDASDNIDGDQYVCTPSDDRENLGALKYNAVCTARSLFENDSNTIIRVGRDRECNAWYDCKAYHYAWDNEKNQYVKVCDKVGLCTELSGDEDNAACSHFASVEYERNLLTYNRPFGEDDYKNRQRGWFDLDYSGYTLYNMPPLQFITAVDLDSTIEKDYRLVNIEDKSCRNDTDCISYSDREGRCVNNSCVYSLNRDFDDKTMLDYPRCKIYPEDDSPFPYKLKNDQTANSKYSNARFSFVAPWDLSDDMSLMDRDFGCYYKKVTYNGGIEKLYPYESDYQPKIISAGDYEGFCSDASDVPCGCDSANNEIYATGETGLIANLYINNDRFCSSSICQGTTDGMSGLCAKRQSKITVYSGMGGYCLMEDESLNLYNETTTGANVNPCLLWYPLDNMLGIRDLKLNAPDADLSNWQEMYFSSAGQPHYCLDAERWEQRSGFVKATEGLINCDAGADIPLVKDYFMPTGCDVDSGSALKCNSNASNILWDDYPVKKKVDISLSSYCDESFLKDTLGVRDDELEDYCVSGSSGIALRLLRDDLATNMLNHHSYHGSSHVGRIDYSFEMSALPWTWHKDYPDLIKFNPNLNKTRDNLVFADLFLQDKIEDEVETYWSPTADFYPAGDLESPFPWYFWFLSQRWFEKNWNVFAKQYPAVGPAYNYMYNAFQVYKELGLVDDEYELVRFNFARNYLKTISDFDGGECAYDFDNYGSVFTCKNYMARDAVTFSRAALRKCGERDAEVDDGAYGERMVSVSDNLGVDYLNHIGKTFRGPECPYGYIPGRLSFFDSWGYRANNRSADTIIMHHECIPEKTHGYNIADFSSSKYPQWYRASSDEFERYDGVIIGIDDCQISSSSNCLARSSSTSLKIGSPSYTKPDMNFDTIVGKDGTKGYYTRAGEAGKHFNEPYYTEANGEVQLISDSSDPRSFETAMPVCTKAVEISENSQLWTDNFYQALVGNGSACPQNEFDPGASGSVGLLTTDHGFISATPSLLNANVVSPMLQGGFSNTGCGFFGALPVAGRNAFRENNGDPNGDPTVQIVTLYNDGSDDSQSKDANYLPSFFNPNQWSCGLNSTVYDSSNMVDQVGYGGSLCFDNRELDDLNSLNWNLRKIFTRADSVWNLSADDFTSYHQSTYPADFSDPIENQDASHTYFSYEESSSEAGDWRRGIEDILDNNGLDYTIHAPIVSAVGMGRENEKSAFPFTLNINGQYNNLDPLLNTSFYPATIQFYFWADHNAMPVRAIYVDILGDGSDIIQIGENRDANSLTSESSFKNYKPICSTGVQDVLGECKHEDSINWSDGATVPGYACREKSDCDHLGLGYECDMNDESHFGDSPLACEDKPFRVDVNFDCVDPESQYPEICLERDDENVVYPCHGEGDSGKYCKFQPRVKVVDNWNMCNSDHSMFNNGGAVNYYMDGYLTRSLELCENNDFAWTYFSGEIIMFPPENEQENISLDF